MVTVLALLTAVILILLNTFVAAGVPWWVIAIVLTMPLWRITLEIAAVVLTMLMVSLVVLLFDAV